MVIPLPPRSENEAAAAGRAAGSAASIARGVGEGVGHDEGGRRVEAAARRFGDHLGVRVDESGGEVIGCHALIMP